MEDFFNSKNIIKILVKWKYQLIVVVALSILFAVFFSSSVFITPLFKSFAVIYPSNIAPYSDESETEQMMQMMQSKDIRDSIIKKFDLAGHYGIDPGYKYYMSVLLFEYSKKVKVAKTPYEAVSIEVWDKDPKIACDMVNEIMYQYNFKIRSLHKEKFGEVVNNYKVIMDAKRFELDSLKLLSSELGTKYGLLDYPNQSREVTRAYLSTGNSSGKAGEINRLRKNMEEKGGEKEMLSQLMPAYANVYSILKLDYDRAVLDYNRNFTYVNVLNKPFPADKKAYPVRWIIVVLSALGTAVVAIFVIGFIERRRMSISSAAVSK
jgi:capsular polysaccharide biosynthesis protein